MPPVRTWWELVLKLFLLFLPFYSKGHLPAQLLLLHFLSFCCLISEALDQQPVILGELWQSETGSSTMMLYFWCLAKILSALHLSLSSAKYLTVSGLLTDGQQCFFSGFLFTPAWRNTAMTPGPSFWGWLCCWDLETSPGAPIPCVGICL